MAEHRRIQLAGLRLHHVVDGRGRRGVPVVIVSDHVLTSRRMRSLHREIASNRLTFMLDLPGQGRSSRARHGHADDAGWLVFWLTRMGFERIHLVTIGAAAGAGLVSARRAPGRIASLTCVSPPARRRGRLRTELLRSVSWMRSGRRDRPRSGEQLVDLAVRVRVPLLVMRGEVAGADGRSMAAELARSAHGVLIDLPEGRDDCYRTHARFMATALQRFWSSIEQRESSTAASS